MHLSPPPWLRLLSVLRRWFCFCCSLVGVCNCSMFCCTLLYVHSSFAIILMGKTQLAALLSLSSRFLVIVVWLFLGEPWVCLQFVIVVFPYHAHYFCIFERVFPWMPWICLWSQILLSRKSSPGCHGLVCEPKVLYSRKCLPLGAMGWYVIPGFAFP